MRIGLGQYKLIVNSGYGWDKVRIRSAIVGLYPKIRCAYELVHVHNMHVHMHGIYTCTRGIKKGENFLHKKIPNFINKKGHPKGI